MIMRLKQLLLSLTAFLLKLPLFGQQDAQYSQYTFNGLYVNTAYAGYKQDFYIHSFYRSQWTGLDGAPENFSFSVDGAVNDKKVGLGLLLSNDVVGAQNLFSATACYSYRIQVGHNENSRLSFGVGAGFIQSGIDGSKLDPLRDGDRTVPTISNTVLLPSGRLGILYSNENVFVGFAADNILTKLFNKDYTDKVPVPQPHYYFNCGGIIKVNDDTKVKPSVLLKSDFHAPASLDFNASVLLRERLWIGGAYRASVPLYSKIAPDKPLKKSTALLGLLEFFANENLRIGYAFDYSLSSLADYSYGSHEISVGIFLRGSRTTASTNRCYF
ncbi:type IX secretion system membrane protein PorP/SprF [Arcticibacter sp. MXS-1]|uniref:PorP/SprF family type IX secretion system membrane protein n=1 Tax=Arcticibacter sp. MXS-1 TaxID=3341726 RepID=UPI0035A90DFA